MIVDIATGKADDTPEETGKDPAAVALGRKGGLEGREGEGGEDDAR